MAVPTAPTVSSILTEAFRRTGTASPTTDQLTRAEDEWLEEVKQEVTAFPGAEWHLLEETVVLIPLAFVSVYPLPSPLGGVRQIVFYDGDERGTAQAGAASSITLAAGATSNVDDVRGFKVFLTGGTGAGQVNRVTAYNGSTKVATVACTWATNPDSTTTYLVANRVEREVSGPDWGIRRSGFAQGDVINQWEFHDDNLYLDPTPDNAGPYALELRGIVDISLIDETNARITKLLRQWRPALIYGVMARIYEDQDDERNVDRTRARFAQMTQQLLIRDRKLARRNAGMAMRSPGGMPRRSMVL